MGTVGTSHHDVKGEMQITKFMSMRVPMHDTGAELLVERGSVCNERGQIFAPAKSAFPPSVAVSEGATSGSFC